MLGGGRGPPAEPDPGGDREPVAVIDIQGDDEGLDVRKRLRWRIVPL